MRYKIFDLGLIDYNKALDLQNEVFESVAKGELDSALILCRHYPVITLGRSAKEGNILVDVSLLKKKNIPLYKVRRGGDVTYHGPGQLMVYPVVNLDYFRKDIHWFLNELEGLAIRVLGRFGIGAHRIDGKAGVWVDDKKIASIGVAIKHWISFHGLSINIKMEDLDNFTLIKPCGMDIMMTSMETVLGEEVAIDKVKEYLIQDYIFKGD